MRRIPCFALLIGAVACGTGDPQNSAVCGFTLLASGGRVLDQVANVNAVLRTPPEAMLSEVSPTRVVGHATARSVPREGPDGLVLTYEGEGMPAEPGFGVALVDDSSEVYRGVMIFEVSPPDYPLMGVITNGISTLPLFGVRVHWSSVNSEKCPIFSLPDTTSQ